MTTILQSKSTTTTGTSITVTFDADPNAGSILVLVVNSTQGVTTPSGWTSRASFAGDQGFYIFDKTSAGAGDVATTVTPNSSAPIAVTALELNADDISGFDVVSTVNGNSSATTVPISGVTSTGIYGALLIAAGALHGWSVAPADPPSYTNSWTHVTSAIIAGTGSTKVGHYVGSKTSSSAAATGGLSIGATATIDNDAGFLIAYSRTPPLVVVDITAVNSATSWTRVGGSSNLDALSDALDSTYMVSSDTPTNIVLDVQLGALDKPPSDFVVRVRAVRAATTATIVGKLYDGATLKSTASGVTPNSGTYTNLLITFPRADLTSLSQADWTAGLRLTLTVSAA